MAVSDARSLPIAVHVASASPHEVKLVETTIAQTHTKEYPTHLIGDRAYDSDELDLRLKRHGIMLVAPNRANRINRTQDRRSLRRYKRRWAIERLFAWLKNFRRLVIRYEYCGENFLAFVQLGCILILLNRFH